MQKKNKAEKAKKQLEKAKDEEEKERNFSVPKGTMVKKTAPLKVWK